MSNEAPQGVIETKELRLVDDEGRTRARLFLDEGEPKLTLYSKRDKKRAGIGLLATGEVGLSLYDSNERLYFAVIVGAEGDPEISVRTRSGKDFLLYPPEEFPVERYEPPPQSKPKSGGWL